MAIQRRKILEKYVYKAYTISVPSNANAVFEVTPQDVGVSQSQNINPTSQNKQYLIHIQTPNNLPIVAGIILIEFPSQFTLNKDDYICYNAHDSQLQLESTFNCIVDTTNQKVQITGYKALTAGIIIKLILIIQNPSATLSNPTFTLKIYSDLAMNNLALSKTTAYANPSPFI